MKNCLEQFLTAKSWSRRGEGKDSPNKKGVVTTTPFVQ